MPTPGEASNQAAAAAAALEQARAAEKRFSIAEQSSRLGNKQDAVCDGSTVKLSALDRTVATLTSDKAREKNAADLAAKVAGLKKQSTATSLVEPLLKTSPTGEDILKLDARLKALTDPDKGPFAGLLVNIQAATEGKGFDADASSIGMIAFVDYLSENASSGKPQEEILKGAYEAVCAAYTALGITEKPVFAAAVVDKKSGVMASVHSQEVAVVVVDNMEQKPADKVKNIEAPADKDGEPTVSTTIVKKGQKIVLCGVNDIGNIKSDAITVKEIVDTLTTPSKEREEKPIEGNVVYTRRATIIPDVHGGKELVKVGAGDSLPSVEQPLSEFTKGVKPGEVIVSAGDVFDRGARSWETAQQMMDLVKKGDAVWNWGNHELLFMGAMGGGAASQEALTTWFYNGGDAMARAAKVDMSAYDAAVAAAGGKQAFFINEAARRACWDKMLPQIQANKNLTELNTFLQENGKAYTIVDNVLVTHAGVLADPSTGKLLDVTINGKNYGKGLEAMDAIQDEVHKGNTDVIGWLANHGGDDTTNQENPFWVREKNYQDVVQQPTTAHALREELNAQAAQRGTKIELVVVGHTPAMADTSGKTMVLPDGSTPTRFLFADTGYNKDGEPRVVQLIVPDEDPNKVTMIYKNPVTGERPKDVTGKNIVDLQHTMDKSLPGAVSHAATGETIDATAESVAKVDAAAAKPVDPLATSGETDKTAETLKHKAPFWADNKDTEPISADDFIKASETQTHMTKDQLKARGIDVDNPQPFVTLMADADGKHYDVVINIFSANSMWVRGAMDALCGKDSTTLDKAEQVKLLQTIQEKLSWEKDNENDPVRKAILAVKHPLGIVYDPSSPEHAETDKRIMTAEVMVMQLNAPAFDPKAAADEAKIDMIEGIRKEMGLEPGVAARSRVDHNGRQITEDGPYQQLHKNGEINKLVRNDVIAADLVLNVAGSAKVNVIELQALGITVTEGMTFNQVQELLAKNIKDAKKGNETPSSASRDALRKYNQFRIVFYGHVYDALKPGGTLTAQSDLGADIRTRLAAFNLQAAINGYPAIRGRKKEEYFEGLQPTSVKDMALKGMEMYIRLIKDPINLNPEAKKKPLGKIYRKVFIQNDAELVKYLAKPEPGATAPPNPNIPRKPGQKDGDDDGRRRNPNPPGHNGPLTPAPDGGNGDGEGNELPVTPVRQKEGDPNNEGEPNNDGPKAAPGGKRPGGNPPGQPGDKGPLVHEVNLGAAATRNAGAQNILQLADHVRATNLAQMKKPFYAKIPILGGVLYSLRHPVKLIWQNNLARSVFEQQNVRFAADFRNIIKGATDKSIPVDLSPELVDFAMSQGNEIRKKSGLLKRIAWRATDYVKGITGLGQTSEMNLAKKWLREEIVGMGSSRVQLSEKLQQVTGSILTEQTNLGERFALKPKDWSIEMANAHALTYKGETRRSLNDDIGKEKMAGVNKQLRIIVEKYCSGTITDEKQLVVEVNKYLKSGVFKTLIPEEQRKAMQASELATNIINIANMVKGRWEEYKQPAEGGGREFDKLSFNVLYGGGEWGGVRAHVETSFLTEVLARRLAERNVGGAELGYAASLVNDVVTYGGAFAAGWGISGLNTVLNKIPAGLLIGGLGPIGGVLGMGAMSTIKETGFSIPLLNKIHWNVGGHEFHPFTYVGRTAKEAGQASREAARGALEGAKGTIRAEMEKTLVKRSSATELTSNIQELIAVPPAEMDETKAMDLLTKLADIDARMRLSDLSGTAHMNYHTQNYIEFTGGKENEQYLALKKSLLDGIVQLQTYGAAHPNFTKGQGLIFTGNKFQYGDGNVKLGLFEKMSALAEAQLRGSSDVDVVTKWIKRELRLNTTDAQKLVNDFYAEQRVVSRTEESESLKRKEANLRLLTAKRGVTTLAKSLITAPVAGAIYGGITGVANTVWTEGNHAVSEGLQQWSGDWGKVLSGEIPVHTVGGVNGVGGHVEADLSPLQQQVILARNIIEPPLNFSGLHETNIDGVNIMLPGHLRYTNDGAGHDYIIDLRDGHVAQDMSNVQIHGEVVNGQSHLIYTDNSGHTITTSNPIDDFKALGVDIKPIDPVHTTHSTDVWSPAQSTHVVDLGGHKVTTPDNAEWRFDKTTNAWDLKATDGSGHVVRGADGQDITLVQDAQFDAAGHIASHGSLHSGVTIADGSSHVDNGTITTETHNVIGKDGRWDETSGRYGFTFAKGAQHTLQDYKSTNSANEAVYTIRAGGGTATTPDGVVHSIPDAVNNGQLGFAVQIPGHGTFVVPPNDGTTGMKLDPSDTHTFTLPNGGEMTYGELAKMVISQQRLQAQPDGFLGTELNHHTDVLALKPEGSAWGSISAVIVPEGVHNIHGYNYHGPTVNTNGMVTADGQHMNGSVIAFGAVRGTTPAGETPITVSHATPGTGDNIPVIVVDKMEKITEAVDVTLPAFSSTTTSTMDYIIPLPGLIPIPVGRENIERAEYGKGNSKKQDGEEKQTSETTENANETQTHATEEEVAEVPLSAEKLGEMAKLRIPEDEMENKNKPYQKTLLPAIEEFKSVIESGDSTRLKAVTSELIKALKKCRSENAEEDARTIERAIRDAQSKLNEEDKKAQLSEQQKQEKAEQAKITRATNAVGALGVTITPKERADDKAKAERFDAILVEAKSFIAAFDAGKASDLAASEAKLKELLKSKWKMKDKDIAIKIEEMQIKLQNEKELAAKAKAQEDQIAADKKAEEQIRIEKEEEAKKAQAVPTMDEATAQKILFKDSTATPVEKLQAIKLFPNVAVANGYGDKEINELVEEANKQAASVVAGSVVPVEKDAPIPTKASS